MIYVALKARRDTTFCPTGYTRVYEDDETRWPGGTPRQDTICTMRPLQADDWVIYPVPSWSGPLWLYEYQAKTCGK